MKTSRPKIIKFRGAVYRLANMPTPEQQDALLRPELTEELTRSQQIALLKSGVEAWNQWCYSHGMIADLQRANLRGADLYMANLRGANLRGADLYMADLRGADLKEANLREVNLRGADLYMANLRGANLEWANLRRANLVAANLELANLREVNFYMADYNDQTQFPQGFDPEAAAAEILF